VDVIQPAYLVGSDSVARSSMAKFIMCTVLSLIMQRRIATVSCLLEETYVKKVISGWRALGTHASCAHTDGYVSETKTRAPGYIYQFKRRRQPQHGTTIPVITVTHAYISTEAQ